MKSQRDILNEASPILDSFRGLLNKYPKVFNVRHSKTKGYYFMIDLDRLTPLLETENQKQGLQPQQNA